MYEVDEETIVFKIYSMENDCMFGFRLYNFLKGNSKW